MTVELSWTVLTVSWWSLRKVFLLLVHDLIELLSIDQPMISLLLFSGI